jgi:AraC-like DNA-binding protein
MRGDRISLRRDPATGVEALRASFSGHAYDLHSHDCYLIGVTGTGVQSFRCRGRWRHSVPGGVVLIEPEEPHDGRAGTDGGFSYGMLYLPADLMGRLRRQLGACGELGFPDNLSRDGRLARAAGAALSAFEGPESRLLRDGVLLELARALCDADALGGRRRPSPTRPARRAREVLHDRLSDDLGLEELTRLAGAQDRYQLSRAFKAAFGAPPHRYLVQLRLNEARRRLARGEAPAAVAAETGFADQSHLGRWFRRAFGQTPAAYARACTDVPDRRAR